MSAALGHSSGWKPSTVIVLVTAGMFVFWTAGGAGGGRLAAGRPNCWGAATGQHRTWKHETTGRKQAWLDWRGLRILDDILDESLGNGFHPQMRLREEVKRKV
jgi:hypothetical protein